MNRGTNIFIQPRALSLFFLVLTLCAHPFSGRAGDYAERNALTWSAFASDNAAVNLSDDVTHVRAGDFSLRFDTASGFDTGVRYPGTASAHWNLTTNTYLVFWCYGVNTNTFQGNQPVIVLNSPAGSYRYEPDHIVTANGSWTLVKVPLAGDAHWLRTATGSPTLADVTQLEIHQDTWDYGFTMFYDGVQFLTLGTNGPAKGPPTPSGVNPDAVIQRVLLFVYDPIMENKGGRRMHEVYGWTAPETLTQGILHDFNSNSHSLYLPQVVETRIADEYPLLIDGFRYDDTSYDQAIQSNIWHGSVFDYWQFMLDHDLVSRVESGDLDEIWIYGSPGSGMWESTMAGQGGYWCNSGPVSGATNQHLVVIMGWNFERGVGEAIHSFGHRAESIMSKIYDGQWLLSRANAWSAFALLDKDAPGLGGVGDVHFPVNGLIDYDWANTNFVWSACDAWANYPYLTNSARSINFHEWSPAGEDPQREYLNWWYAHFPRRAGKAPSPDDRLNNWWRYLIDVDQFKNGDGMLTYSSAIGSAQITSPTNTSFVDGIVPVTVDALVDGALGRVDLYVDGVYYASDFLAPFKFSWVTDGLLGAHTLTAKAYELQAGTETVSSSITVNVRGASVSGVVQSNAVPVSGVTVTALGSVRRWLRQTASPGTPIPDNNFGGVTNVIEITQTGAISSVHVGVTVRHPRRSDLRLTLIHPNGTTVRLASEGGNAEPDLIAFYPDLTVPAESFSALDNLPVTGTWKLIVADLSPGVSGQVESWSLGLNYLEPQTFVATTDLNGSYSFTNLPTGDYEIRPTKPGVTFLPIVTNLSLSADTLNASFETVVNQGPSTILANGSFELGYAGWTASGNQSISPRSSEGTNAVQFNPGQVTPNGVLAQTFATTVGQTYKVVFDIGTDWGTPFTAQSLRATVTGNSTLFSQVVTVFGSGDVSSKYTSTNFTFLANSTTTTLVFQDVSSTGLNVDLLLDNVRVSALGNQAPDGTIALPSGNMTIEAGQSVNFAGSGSDPDNNLPLTYQWTFGSGSGLPNSTVQNPGSLQFANAGSFLVAFTVTDGLGLADPTPATLTITVTNQGPATILANGSFELGYTSWTPSGNQWISLRSIDGTNAVQFNPGQATPNGVLSQAFTTTPGQTYLLAFDIGTDWGTPFTAQSLRATVTGNSTLFTQVVTVFGSGDVSSKYTSTNFTFLANSTTTTLAFQDVSSTGLNVDLLLDNVRVSALGNQAPDGTIALPSGNMTIEAGQSVNFAGSGSDPDNNLSLTYQWTFGSGSGLPNSTVQNPGSLQFANAGSFLVAFTVTDGLGLADPTPATLTITVTNQGPATILANGSFELGYTSWNPSGNQWISLRSSDGTNAVQFNPGQATPNGVLSQAFTTTPGQTYLLAFDIGTDWGTPFTAQSLRATVTGNSTLFTQVVTVFGSGDVSSKYTSTNFTFLANSTTTTLVFQDVSSTGLNVDLLLDNVRITGLPVITNQPPNLSISVGTAATFTVGAAGTAPLSYQWRFNGASISGATTTSYMIANVQAANAGNYDAVVSNSAGSVTSAVAVLTVSSGILANGSFESGYTGWTASGNQAINARASDGTNAVQFNPGQLTPNGVLAQTFATTVGQTYKVAFDIGADWGTPSTAQSLQTTVTGNSTLFSQIVTVFGTGDSSSKYTSTNFTFLANSITTTLTFQDVSPTGLNVDLLLDNVRITAQGGQSLVVAAHPGMQTLSTLGMLSIDRQAEGSRIHLEAGKKGNYELQYSRDLKVWNSLGIKTASGAEGSEFLDTNAPQALRFYRILAR